MRAGVTGCDVTVGLPDEEVGCLRVQLDCQWLHETRAARHRRRRTAHRRSGRGVAVPTAVGASPYSPSGSNAAAQLTLVLTSTLSLVAEHATRKRVPAGKNADGVIE